LLEVFILIIIHIELIEDMGLWRRMIDSKNNVDVVSRLIYNYRLKWCI